MAGAAILATAPGGVSSAPVTVMVSVVAIVWVLWSRTRGQPLSARRLLVLPVVLAVIGASDLTGSSTPKLTAADIAFLAAGVVVSAVLGAARGVTVELYSRNGELWQRYRVNTIVLWGALIATKVALAGVASAVGAPAGGGTGSLLLSLGSSLLAEAAILGPRALSTGLAFASERTDTSRRWLPRWAGASPWCESETAPLPGETVR